MQTDQPVWPPAPSSAVPEPEPVPPASRLPFLPGFVGGLLLYAVASVAGWLCFISGLIPASYANPALWLALIFLSNSLPVTIFFFCRRKLRFFSFGLLAGSFIGCALHLMYAISAWQEEIMTAPAPG